MSLLLFFHEFDDSLLADSYEELGGFGSARNEWTFVLANSAGTAQDILDPAIQTAELTMRRSEPCTLDITLQGEDDRAYNIIQQLTLTKPLVYAYRDSVLYFAGFLSGVRSDAEEDVQMTATFTDALGTLQYRVTDSDVELYDQDASNIIAGSVAFGTSLLAQANATAATGLTAGTVTTGIGVETFVTSRDVVYDKVRELVQLTAGPDLRVNPVAGSSTFGTLDVGPIYTDSTVYGYFAYGGTTTANCSGFDWEITPPATRVICVGSDVEGISTSDANTTSAESRVGVWQNVIQSNDLYLENDCKNAANAAVRLDWTVSASFTPDPSRAPRPLRDYNVGQLVSVRANRGSMLYKGNLRVREIQITIDDQGIETAHRVGAELGGPGTGQQIDSTGLYFITADTAVAANNLAASFA